VLDLFAALADIHGNIWALAVLADIRAREIPVMRSLPPAYTFDAVLLCHGTPASDEA